VNHWLLTHSPGLRLGAFALLLLSFGVWEWMVPSRPLRDGRGRRWLANFSLVVAGAGISKLAAPVGAMAASLHAQTLGLGLLHGVEISPPLAVVIAMVSMDLVIYTQHLAFHHVPILWRLHKVHHTDRDMDVSTALRFHPLEIVFSLAIKVGAVYALGAPPVSVLLFEVVLNGTAMFNHSNVSLGPRLDAAMRLLVVTPNMHRIHHSTRIEETNSNYGFNVPWWDRIFRTYVPAAADGDKGLTVGLPEAQDEQRRLLSLLLLPFR